MFIKKQIYSVYLIAFLCIVILTNLQARVIDNFFTTLTFTEYHSPVPATDYRYQEFADCNYDLMLAPRCGENDKLDLNLARSKGFRGAVYFDSWNYDWDENNTEEIDARVLELANLYSTNSGLFGYFLQDEPGADQFNGLARAKERLMALDPFR